MSLSTAFYSPLPSNKSSRAIKFSTEYSNYHNSNNGSSSYHSSSQMDNTRLFAVNRILHSKRTPWQGSKVFKSPTVEERIILGSRPFISWVECSSLSKRFCPSSLTQRDCGLKAEQNKQL